MQSEDALCYTILVLKLKSALTDSAPDPPIIDLLHNTVSPHLQKRPPSKENITDSIEPTSSCETAAGNYNDNYIGLAVGQRLSVEDRIKYLNPWTPTYASEFPSSIRADQQSHTKSGIERRRRLLPRHLEDYPWLAVSRVNPGALCVPCVLFTASGSGVGGRSQGRGQISGKLLTKPLDRFDELTGKDGSLTRHAKTRYHQDAILAFDDFKRVCVDQSNRKLDISCQLNESHRLTVEKITPYLSILWIQFCCANARTSHYVVTETNRAPSHLMD